MLRDKRKQKVTELKEIQKSRKGFKLKTKSKNQIKQLRQFFATQPSNKWSKETITKLADEIGLCFKSTNKWLWDQKNRLEQKERNQMANIFEIN